MMTDVELRKLAHYIVAEAKEDTELLHKVTKLFAMMQEERMVTPKVAADMLGISVRHLRRIKGHFTCVKSGDSQQAGLLFNAATLLSEYEAYVKAAKSKVVALRIVKCGIG